MSSSAILGGLGLWAMGWGCGCGSSSAPPAAINCWSLNSRALLLPKMPGLRPAPRRSGGAGGTSQPDSHDVDDANSQASGDAIVSWVCQLHLGTFGPKWPRATQKVRNFEFPITTLEHATLSLTLKTGTMAFNNKNIDTNMHNQPPQILHQFHARVIAGRPGPNVPSHEVLMRTRTPPS